MNKIIGGLLVVTIISNSLDQEYEGIVLRSSKNNREIICIIKEEDDTEIETQDIDKVINELDGESRTLTNLFKEKEKIVNDIKTTMDLKVHNKIRMNEQQISYFKNFNYNYVEKIKELKNILKNINIKRNLTLVQNEILHNKKTDQIYIYTKLEILLALQKQAVECLRRIVEVGTQTLAVL